MSQGPGDPGERSGGVGEVRGRFCVEIFSSPEGAVRSAPSRTGFVIASLPFPPSAAPPLPARPRLPYRVESQPGSPAPASTEREPPTGCSWTPRCRRGAGFRI
nr:CDC42 small effector protein 1 isoform X1 [Oryctolagus cuniculus]